MKQFLVVQHTYSEYLGTIEKHEPRSTNNEPRSTNNEQRTTINEQRTTINEQR